MKHKRFLVLLSAAAVVLSAVPALPVFAEAANDPIVSETATLGDYRNYCTKKGDAGTYHLEEGETGTFSYKWDGLVSGSYGLGPNMQATDKQNAAPPDVRYEGEVDLGAYGWYGISGIVQSTEGNADFEIIEGWGENTDLYQRAGQKIGGFYLSGLQYDLYRSVSQSENAEAETVCYRLIPYYNRCEVSGVNAVENTVQLSQLMNEMQKIGMPYQKFDCLHLFVNTGEKTDGTVSGSVVFTRNEYKSPDTASGETDDGYSWVHDRYGSNCTSDFTYKGNGCFTVEWNGTGNVDTVCGQQIPDSPLWADLETLRYDYDCTTDITGSVNIGLSCILNSPKQPLNYTEGVIVDGWTGDRPYVTKSPDATYLGTFSADGVEYDMYYSVHGQESIAGTAPTWFKFWSVRKENAMAENGALTCSTNIMAHLEEWNNVKPEKAFMGTNISSVSATAYTAGGESAASITFTKNGLRNEASGSSHDETGTLNGYKWEHWTVGGTSDMARPGQDGVFSCKWKDADAAMYTVGKEFPAETKWKDAGQIQYDYALDLESGGAAFAGITGQLGNLTAFYIIDAWTGSELPVNTAWTCNRPQKLGEITLNDAVYDIYKGFIDSADIQGNRAITNYYSLRRENLAADSKHIVNSVDVTAHLNAYASLGMDAEQLDLTALLIEADRLSGEKNPGGSAKVTKNTVAVKQQAQSAVRGDANCDGTLDVADAVLVARVVNEDATAVITEQGIANGNTDGKAGLGSGDITMLLQAIAKKIKL